MSVSHSATATALSRNQAAPLAAARAVLSSKTKGLIGE